MQVGASRAGRKRSPGPGRDALSRGEFEAAWEDEHVALALARQRGDTAQLIAALSFTCSNLADEGRFAEALPYVDELVPLVRSFGTHGALIRVGAFAEQLGAGEALRAALAEAGPKNAVFRMSKAVNAVFDGDFPAAADVFAEVGNVALEAFTRHHGGLHLLAVGRTAEGEAQLEQALVFHRRVGAAHYVAAAEDAVASAQRDSA